MNKLVCISYLLSYGVKGVWKKYRMAQALEVARLTFVTDLVWKCRELPQTYRKC